MQLLTKLSDNNLTNQAITPFHQITPQSPVSVVTPFKKNVSRMLSLCGMRAGFEPASKDLTKSQGCATLLGLSSVSTNHNSTSFFRIKKAPLLFSAR